MRKLWIFAPCIAFILFTGCRPDSSDEKLTRARLRELAGVTSWLPANSGLKVKLPNPSTAPPSFATDDLLLDLHNDAADWTQPSAHAQRTEWLSQLSEWRSQAFDGNERNPVRSNEDVESLTKAIRFLVFEARLHGLENDLATASAIMELAANTVVEAIETAPGIRFRDLIPALNTVLAELRCGDTTLHVGADIIAARFTGKQDFRHLSQLKAREEFAESGIRLLHEFAESDEPIDLLSMQLAGGGDPEPYAEILYRITGGVNNFINIEDTVRLAGSWIEADLRLAQGDVGKVEAHTQQIKRLILQDWGADPFQVSAEAWDTVDMETRIKKAKNSGGILIAYSLHRAIIPIIQSAYITQIDIDIARLKSARASNRSKLRAEAQIHKNPLTGLPYQLDESGEFINLNCDVSTEDFPLLAALCAGQIRF